MIDWLLIIKDTAHHTAIIDYSFILNCRQIPLPSYERLFQFKNERGSVTDSERHLRAN